MGLWGDLGAFAKLVGVSEVTKIISETAVETLTGKPTVQHDKNELSSHDQKYAEKQYQLALATKEHKQLMALLFEAAQLGHMEAQYQLGVQHQYHANESSHPLIAANWYRRAAEQGHAMAQFALAEMYHNGEGVSLDNKQAVKWYLRAAQKGHVEAQASLAHMYAKGFGVQKDLVQATFWYKKAAEQGDSDALDSLSRLK